MIEKNNLLKKVIMTRKLPPWVKGLQISRKEIVN